ncbi:MAG: hypothetical protein K9L82_02145 [Chromatiaceae bacterium]|nr:hypothetical protein [Chromatiaceae bacterium]
MIKNITRSATSTQQCVNSLALVRSSNGDGEVGAFSCNWHGPDGEAGVAHPAIEGEAGVLQSNANAV